MLDLAMGSKLGFPKLTEGKNIAFEARFFNNLLDDVGRLTPKNARISYTRSIIQEHCNSAIRRSVLAPKS